MSHLPSRRRGLALVAFLIAVMAVASVWSPAYAAPTHFIYDDSLRWDNWSWDTSIKTGATSPVHAGSRSMAVTYNRAWAGLQFHTNGISSSGFSNLEFALRPGSGSFPNISVALYNNNGLIKKVVGSSYAGTNANGWRIVSIPLSDLGASNTTIRRVQIQDRSGRSQPTFHIDSLRLTESESAGGGGGSTSPSSSDRSFKPSQASSEVNRIINAAADKYNLPRWFYYSLIQRESSFNPRSTNGRDHGLTQLGGAYYTGEAYPMWLSSPNNNHRQYGWDMGFSKYGRWIRMDDVSRMTNPYDAQQNIDRFSTGYAVPAFHLFKRVYGLSDTETLRAVAFHWNKGIFRKYESWNTDYLGLYDTYVSRFKSAVEAEDGRWNGNPRLP